MVFECLLFQFMTYNIVGIPYKRFTAKLEMFYLNGAVSISNSPIYYKYLYNLHIIYEEYYSTRQNIVILSDHANHFYFLTSQNKKFVNSK